MTKSFLFPETNSERVLPAPNENGLRRCFSPGFFAVLSGALIIHFARTYFERKLNE